MNNMQETQLRDLDLQLNELLADPLTVPKLKSLEKSKLRFLIPETPANSPQHQNVPYQGAEARPEPMDSFIRLNRDNLGVHTKSQDFKEGTSGDRDSEKGSETWHSTSSSHEHKTAKSVTFDIEQEQDGAVEDSKSLLTTYRSQPRDSDMSVPGARLYDRAMKSMQRRSQR